MYTYDNLNQLVTWARGTLNGSKDAISGTALRTQNYNTDGQGNFASVVTNGSTQTRGHNRKNRITSVSGATTPLFDNNGNMTRDDTGRTPPQYPPPPFSEN